MARQQVNHMAYCFSATFHEPTKVSIAFPPLTHPIDCHSKWLTEATPGSQQAI